MRSGCGLISSRYSTLRIFQFILYTSLERFAVLLNICMGCYQLTTAVVQMIALHHTTATTTTTTTGSGQRQAPRLRLLLAIRMVSWLYVYLHVLPFDYLLPVTYSAVAQNATPMGGAADALRAAAKAAAVGAAAADEQSMWLLVGSLWLWYGLGVWQSPVLQLCYQLVYRQKRTPPIDRTPSTGDGGGDEATYDGWQAIARCVLVPRTIEYQHFLGLRQAFAEIRLAQR